MFGEKTMKTKRFLQGFATFAIIVLFAGCTNILDSKTAEKSKENTSVSINFNANGRYISAGSFELNRITSWKVIFKSDSGEKDIELAWSSDTSDTSSNSSSPSLNYSEGVLTAKLIPTGIYDITLEGSYSEGNSTVTVSGTKEDVTVSSETAKNYITVLVGLKKDSSVKGSLELSFNTTGIPDYDPALRVTLKNIQTGDIEYSTDSTDENQNPLVFSASDSSGYTLTGTDIAPGWYKLEFYHSDSVKIEIPGDKMMVEIASGIKTTDSDIKLSGTSVKRYYATNDNSESDQKMNGLSVSSRKNLTALLETLTKNWPDVPEVDIFMDKVPEIDIKTFNELKKTLGDSKNLSIYSGESTSPIIAAYFISNTNAVNTDLSGSAWLVATDGGNKKFEITNLSVGQEQANSIDITLKNGACLDVTGEMSFSGNLNIYAIKDSEDGTIQDNFASYIATPFFSSFSDTDVNSFSLREYASKKVSEHNTINSVPKEAGVEFCIKPASMKGITAESSDNFSIEAYYSSGSDNNVYASGSAIPYESSSLEIRLKKPEGIEIKNCLWYLNGESFDDSGSELTGFDPTQASSLNVDGKNVISCFASVGEKLYLCEFNFTFKTPSRSAAVWFSGEGNNYSMKQIYDYTDSAATESIIKETSKYYCFDKNYNLWTAIPGDALTLNKYSMKVSTGSYSTTPDLTKPLSEITSLSDMCYDCVNSYIYLLVSGDASVSVYAVSTGSEPTIVASAQIDMSNLKTTTFTNIAVNGNDFYFADKLCNVYKAIGTVTSDTIEIETPTLVNNLASSDILKDYDSSKYDGTYDSISITDLQFGDGLGSGTENVYALVKETSDGLGFTTNPDYFYSRGALVKINTQDSSSIEKFGWTYAQTTLSYTYYGNSYTDYYYIPDATDSSNTAFFGPEKFCAVVPKKIVVVDDGFYWKAGDTGDGKIKNKDSIVEFDIDSSTLTRGSASISASFNIGATDYYSGKVEN